MLITSLTLLFAYTTFISWYEVLIIVFSLLVLVYSITPRPAESYEYRQPFSLYYYLQWSWLGYLRLKDAFWPFLVLYNGILLYIDYRIDQGSFTAASWVTVHTMLALPLVYWIGATWRCADKCSARRWAVLARWITVLSLFDLVLRWVIYHYYPNIFFNCQQMILQWGDCV
jgi:hypothetical protein